MAYVKVTDAMITGVTRRISVMEKGALARMGGGRPDPTSADMEALREAVERDAWKAAPELRDKMPTSWMDERPDQGVTIIKENDTSRLSVSIEDVGFVLPPNTGIGTYMAFKIRYDALNGGGRVFADRRFAWAQAVAEKRQEFSDVQKQVVMFLRSQKSLNAALKEMPELEMYIPSEYMERVRKKHARSTTDNSDTASVEVDRDKLTAIAVTHRMNSSNE